MPENEHNHLSHTNVAILIVVILLAFGIGIGFVTLQRYFNSPVQLGTQVDYRAVPAQWVTYCQTQLLEINVEDPVCFAVVDSQSFLVADASAPALYWFDFDGKELNRFPLSDKPQALAVGKPGQIFEDKFVLVSENTIDVYSKDGKKEKIQQIVSEKGHRLASVVLSAETLFIADSTECVILQFDADGKLLKTFGKEEPQNEKDDEKNFAGFAVYQSPITMTLSPKTGLLHVTNPGKHRIETFTPDGIYEPALSWGFASGDLAGFVGCCNPVYAASLPDGRIITAEKSVSRIKIFRTNRLLDCFVAGPGVLDRYPLTVSPLPKVEPNVRFFAVDVLPCNRIAVFDFNWKLLRVFTSRLENTHPPGQTSAKP